MITAMQSAKLQACAKLMEAQRLVIECRSLICMARPHRDAMETAVTALDAVVEEMAPANTKYIE